jgi:hypothetical protein
MMRKYKYKINEDYFNNIDNQEKSYLLGFIFADGCVRITKRKNTDSYQFRLKIHIKDLIIIEKLRELTESNYPIVIKDNMCSISISNKKFVENLINIGCVPRKTKILTYPDINEKFNSSFILGYFDGDGSISLLKEWFNFNLLGTESFLSSVKVILENEKVFTSLPKKYSGMGDVFQLTIYDKQSIINLRQYFYNNKSLYLERKRENFDKIEYKKGKRILSNIDENIVIKNYNKITLSKIAILTNSSIASVFRVVKKLRKKGVIKDESIFKK